MLRTSNPVLSKSFGGFAASAPEAPIVREDTMTIPGTVNKTTILLALVIVAGLWPWHLMKFDPEAALSWLWIGMFGGFATALVIIFKKEWAGPLAPLYAALEGLALGAVSAFCERQFPGIVFQSVSLTIGVLLAMLVIYRTGAIKATENFKMGVVAATCGIALVYVMTWVMRSFGMPVSFMHSTGWVGIGISMLVVVIAALNL